MESLSEVGGYLMSGWGVRRDKRKGLTTLKRGARSCSVLAQYELGRCFRFGWGTPKDEIRAVLHCKMGAEEGHVDALNQYANCWICEMGVEKNSKYELELLRAEANLGSTSAMEELGYIYRYGTEDIKNLKQSLVPVYHVTHDY